MLEGIDWQIPTYLRQKSLVETIEPKKWGRVILGRLKSPPFMILRRMDAASAALAKVFPRKTPPESPRGRCAAKGWSSAELAVGAGKGVRRMALIAHRSFGSRKLERQVYGPASDRSGG